MDKKDKIRYSEVFKLKVMEELRDGKFKSVKEVALGYGLSEISVYNWMHRYGVDHLKGSLIFVKTRTELDQIKEMKKKILQLKAALADSILDQKINEVFLDITCKRLDTIVEELKKKNVEM